MASYLLVGKPGITSVYSNPKASIQFRSEATKFLGTLVLRLSLRVLIALTLVAVDAHLGISRIQNNFHAILSCSRK